MSNCTVRKVAGSASVATSRVPAQPFSGRERGDTELPREMLRVPTDKRSERRPVMLDDTCYFLPFDDERSAARAAAALRSPLASTWFRARIFWDDKRPIRKSVLQSLDLRLLPRAARASSAAGATRGPPR